MAAAIGLAAGLLEVLILGLKKLALGTYTHLNPQFAWLAPLSYAMLALFLACAVRLVTPGARADTRAGIVAFLTLTCGVSGVLFLATGIHKGALVVLAIGVAVQVARMIARPASVIRRRITRAFPWLAGAVTLVGVSMNAALAWSGRDSRGATMTSAPSIVWVLWDTVRAASLGVYGYERETTPTLERLASRGVVFERAISPSPWTLPTHASMFTGLAPHALETDWKKPLENEPATVAEILRANGYRTGGFIANLFYCSRESGLDRGFMDWKDYPVVSLPEFLRSTSLARAAVTAGVPAALRLATRITRVAAARRATQPADATRATAAASAPVVATPRVQDAAAATSATDSAASETSLAPHDTLQRRIGFRQRLRLLQDAGRKDADAVNREFLDWLDADPDRPFFAFLNLFDAHAPYLPPAPFDAAFGARLPGRNPFLTDGRRYSPRELQAEIDAYDGAIAWLDDRLARLIAALEQRGVLDRTILIVTSDHGEEFLEHGVMTHGNSLYDPALHVPLLIIAPGRAPQAVRVPHWVSTTDLAATVLDLAGVDARLPGRTLRRFWSDPAPLARDADTLRARVSFSWRKADHYPISKGDIEAVFVDPWKYILNGDGREELYDLRADPGETVDLAGTAADSVLPVLRQRVGRETGRRTAS